VVEKLAAVWSSECVLKVIVDISESTRRSWHLEGSLAVAYVTLVVGLL
jgi:hypothetical protein